MFVTPSTHCSRSAASASSLFGNSISIRDLNAQKYSTDFSPGNWYFQLKVSRAILMLWTGSNSVLKLAITWFKSVMELGRDMCPCHRQSHQDFWETLPSLTPLEPYASSPPDGSSTARCYPLVKAGWRETSSDNTTTLRPRNRQQRFTQIVDFFRKIRFEYAATTVKLLVSHG